MTKEKSVEKIAEGIASRIILGTDAIGGNENRIYHRALEALRTERDCADQYFKAYESEKEFSMRLIKERDKLKQAAERLREALEEIQKDEFLSEDCLHGKHAREALQSFDEAVKGE